MTAQKITDRLACHGCDLAVRWQEPGPGESVRCPRCGSLLMRRPREGLQVPLALAVTALAFYFMANIFPIMTLEIMGKTSHGTVFTGVSQLVQNGYPELAAVVFLFIMVLPLVKLSALIYLLAPLVLGRRLPGLLTAARWSRHIGAWAMVDIFMLGIMVAYTKLAAIAQVTADNGLFAFTGLFFSMVLVSATLDWHRVWEALEPR